MDDISYQDIKRAYVSKVNAAKTTLCYSGKYVYVRPIKMKDKKEFLKLMEKENNELLDAFIDNLIEKYVSTGDDTPIDAKTLVDQERHQLLMVIRQLSTTQESIQIDHVCPKCKVLNKNIQFDLTNIIINSFSVPAGYENTLESKNGNVKFSVGLLTRGEIIEIEKHITDKSIDTKVEKDFVYLASTIKEMYLKIDDIERKYIPTIPERIEFVENLSFDDFDKIRKFFEACGSFGLSLGFKFKCTDCDYKNEKEEAKIVNFFIK
jgi:predicted kinase